MVEIFEINLPQVSDTQHRTYHFCSSSSAVLIVNTELGVLTMLKHDALVFAMFSSAQLPDFIFYFLVNLIDIKFFLKKWHASDARLRKN